MIESPPQSTRKICLIGDFGVGKTSLIARFVRQTFSERYLTTVGVKIDTKLVQLDDRRSMKLVIWDIAGGLDTTQSHTAFFQGISGALLVVDGTRAPTLQTALTLKDMLMRTRGPIPCLVLVNKGDLIKSWELDPEQLDASAGEWLMASAKTGEGVEAAFHKLAPMLV